jgi:hypothetical protein
VTGVAPLGYRLGMLHLADLAPYGSLLAVIAAVVFGTLTLRQWQRTRYLAAAAKLVHTIQTEQFNTAIARVVELPNSAPPESIREDPELAAAVHAVVHAFESLGVLVFHRALQLHLVGGYVRASWHRLQPYVEARRGDLGAMFGEWFQWSAERLEQYPAPGKRDGAHVAFRGWKP